MTSWRAAAIAASLWWLSALPAAAQPQRPEHALTTRADALDAPPLWGALTATGHAGWLAHGVANRARQGATQASMGPGGPVATVVLAARERVAAAVAGGHGYAPPAIPFEALRGTLPMPTRGRRLAGFGSRVGVRGGTSVRHTGWSFAARQGDAVTTVAPGVVMHAGPVDGLDLLVLIDHGGGYHTVYAHLSRLDVSAGDTVAAGDAVGDAGGRSVHDAIEVYFELRYAGIPQDPAEWFR